MKKNKTVLFLSTFFLLVNVTALVAQQRSPGGGAAAGTQEDYRRELERALNTTRSNAAAAGAWWMDPAIVSRLGLTKDQVARIEKIFETHRQTLTSTFMQLERDDRELKRLLESETVDRAAIRAQVDRVIRSRSDMERANAAMTLDMREQLSQAQWLALQAQRSQSEYLGELRRRTRVQ